MQPADAERVQNSTLPASAARAEGTESTQASIRIRVLMAV